MKYIFLDFDGVLNSGQYFKSPIFRLESAGLSEAHIALVSTDIHFDPEAVQLMSELVKLSQAKVVCSSTWRHNHTLEELNKMLTDRGATFQMIDVTPRGEPRPGSQKVMRGDEIQEYLDRLPEPPESFVIIDDTSDMDHLRERLVQTTWDKGFRKNHLDWALRILEVEY